MNIYIYIKELISTRSAYKVANKSTELQGKQAAKLQNRIASDKTTIQATNSGKQQKRKGKQEKQQISSITG
jgi:hypothetical protein